MIVGSLLTFNWMHLLDTVALLVIGMCLLILYFTYSLTHQLFIIYIILSNILTNLDHLNVFFIRFITRQNPTFYSRPTPNNIIYIYITDQCIVYRLSHIYISGKTCNLSADSNETCYVTFIC